MQLTLYPYQKSGVRFLKDRERGYLADEMGLGKTAQAILAARAVKARSVQVVCPATAVDNWHEEFEKWGYDGERDAISYSALIRRKGQIANPELVVLDEAHYCKSPGAKRSRAALTLARDAPRAYLLSGTPMPNDPTELWAPVKYLWPELAAAHGITTKDAWRQRYTKCRPTEWGPKPYAVRNGGELRQMLNQFMLRRRLADVGLQLPPLRVHVSYLRKDSPEFTAALAEYKEYDERDPLEDGEVFTSTLRRLLGEAKAGAIARTVSDELMNGHYSAVVVLYYHKAVGNALREAFTTHGHGVLGFDGSTPSGARQDIVRRFQAGEAPIFLAQQTSAGVAITLTRASEIVLAEPSWTPDDNAQAIKRIHRIGQDTPCRARLFAVRGTVDAAVMRTLANKITMRQEVFGG